MKNVPEEFAKHRVIQIHARTANIRLAVIFMADMSANVPHHLAVAGISAKRLIPEFRTIRTLRIQDCAKS